MRSIRKVIHEEAQKEADETVREFVIYLPGVECQSTNEIDTSVVSFCNEQYPKLYSIVVKRVLFYRPLATTPFIRALKDLVLLLLSKNYGVVLIGHSIGGAVVNAIATMDEIKDSLDRLRFVTLAPTYV